MQEYFLEIERLVKQAKKVLCIAHKRPDGDTLGATNAIFQSMKEMGKEAVMACVDDIPEKYCYLPQMRSFVKEFDFRDFDLIFISDAGASYMTKYDQIYPEMYQKSVPIINLDHHSSNDNFGTVNVVDIQSASTTILIYKIWSYLGWKITPGMATALITGIYNDTGSLMHQNTTLEVFEITAKLVELGGKINPVVKNLFKTTPLAAMKIWGRVLERAQVNADGVTVAVLTNQDFLETGANTEDLSGVVDFINCVPGTKFAVLLNEDGKGNVKGSFRTRRDDVDVAKLAENFGGGGHQKAAGFTMEGRLQREVRWKVEPVETENLLPNQSTPISQTKSPLALFADVLEIPTLSKKT